MKYQPFSVAISVYKNDNPAFFDRALESITDNQTLKPEEIVLVVDGPVSMELDKVIDKYSARYNLKIIRLPKNAGLGNALKIATENCTNGLIARMDSDDVSVFDRFEQQLRFFKANPETDVFGGDITEFIDDEDNVVARRTVPTIDSDIKKDMKKRCAFNHVSVMFKKESLLRAGGYMDWFWNEDYYLWIRMWEKGYKFANTGTVLVNVRTGIDMYARRGGKKYFNSEIALQKYMLKKKLISLPTYLLNWMKRFIVQRLLTDRLRGYVYKRYARK